MKSRISCLLACAGAVTLVTTACNVDPQKASQAAERVMTVAAQITPDAVSTAMTAARDTPAPAAPTAPSLVYARCITHGKTALLQQPQAGADELAPLGNRSIITAFGRTADATWVLGWNADDVRGWLPASIIGCTAPVEELGATDAGVLLTPVAVAEVITEATSEATAEMTATTMINAVTATPEATLESTATEAPAATPTRLPIATATARPTRTPLPTPTPAPTKTPLAATTAPALPARVITVVVVVTATPAQVRDLRCDVTPGTPVNLRKGASRTAQMLDTLQPGTRFLAQGRNEDATWLYGFTEHQMPGWLIASSVDCDGDPAQLVEVDR